MFYLIYWNVDIKNILFLLTNALRKLNIATNEDSYDFIYTDSVSWIKFNNDQVATLQKKGISVLPDYDYILVEQYEQPDTTFDALFGFDIPVKYTSDELNAIQYTEAFDFFKLFKIKNYSEIYEKFEIIEILDESTLAWDEVASTYYDFVDLLENHYDINIYSSNYLDEGYTLFCIQRTEFSNITCFVLNIAFILPQIYGIDYVDVETDPTLELITDIDIPELLDLLKAKVFVYNEFLSLLPI